MELTQQHFDQVVKELASKDDLKGLATKDDLKGLASKDEMQKAISGSEKKIIARIDDAQEELARMTKNGFISLN